MSNPSLSNRVVLFPTPVSTKPQPDPVKQLVRAARAAERAITLALGTDVARKNQIVIRLRTAIAEVKKSGTRQ
jgi:hypothetical protein